MDGIGVCFDVGDNFGPSTLGRFISPPPLSSDVGLKGRFWLDPVESAGESRSPLLEEIDPRWEFIGRGDARPLEPWTGGRGSGWEAGT